MFVEARKLANVALAKGHLFNEVFDSNQTQKRCSVRSPQRRSRGLWVAHASRVLVFGVAPKQSFSIATAGAETGSTRKVRDREDAITNTRDACATFLSATRPLSGFPPLRELPVALRTPGDREQAAHATVKVGHICPSFACAKSANVDWRHIERNKHEGIWRGRHAPNPSNRSELESRSGTFL